MIKKYNLIIILFFLISIIGNAISENNFFIEAKKNYDKKKYDESKFLFQKNIVFNPKDEISYLYLAKIHIFEENEQEKDSSSIPQSLSVLKCIANSAPIVRSDGKEPTKYTAALMEDVFVELFRYRESTTWSNSRPVHVLRYSYLEQIKKRLMFLRDMTLQECHLKLAWRHFECICKEFFVGSVGH